MSAYKLATTSTHAQIEFLQVHRREVAPALHPGIDRALALVADIAGDDPHEWVSQILQAAANAPDNEIPGLTRFPPRN